MLILFLVLATRAVTHEMKRKLPSPILVANSSFHDDNRYAKSEE